MIYPNQEFWKVFKETPGALSSAEAIAIMHFSSLAPGGTFIELGSHRGKSAMSALQKLGIGVFHLVEPDFSDRQIKVDVMGRLLSTISPDKDIVINMIADYSYNVIEKHAPYSFVFWDSGEHAGEVLTKERDQLENSMISGGILCSHDIGNQFTQQTDAMNHLVSTGKFEWLKIDWQPIFDYVKEHHLENGNNSWHLYPELPHPPNFVGALKRN